MGEKNNLAGVVNPPLLFAVTIIIGLLLNWAYPLPIFRFDWSRELGTAVFLLGFLMGVPAVLQMRKAQTSPNPYKPTSAIVQSGPFRFTRNPIYLSFCIHYTGITLFANSAWLVFFFPVLIGMVIDWVIVREEAYLEKNFGDAYVEYKERVRRWV